MPAEQKLRDMLTTIEGGDSTADARFLWRVSGAVGDCRAMGQRSATGRGAIEQELALELDGKTLDVGSDEHGNSLVVSS